MIGMLDVQYSQWGVQRLMAQLDTPLAPPQPRSHVQIWLLLAPKSQDGDIQLAKRHVSKNTKRWVTSRRVTTW